ncbi:hypothetical protein [Chondromyces apiculatus]|uniref:Uncharacterized protein n=1 Tax=Chondromyces apiculatus DSM 436 TaxID=1192034 RepID=A0A017TD20_9BACT|nr:hypothetical protein [Chondromyces apiculatus]EYF07114.1 Hypothetical protein CAP_0593 [Chondromyces apiculatus DSM 436]
MKVHKEQLEALGRMESEAYEERLVGFLRRTVTRARAAGAAEVEARVRVDVGEARALGLSTERQIAAYVAAWWVLGEGFAERFPAIGEALADEGCSADEKAQVLLAHLDGKAQKGGA